MNIVIPQESVDSDLSSCTDGETGDFTLTGATFKLVDGVGAVISGDTITKSGEGEAGAESETPAETGAEGGVEEPMPKGKMSPAAMAVVGRKGGY